MKRAVVITVIGLALMLVLAPALRAEVYTLAIGYNGVPPEVSAGAGGEELAPLTFADDDAAAFHTFSVQYARRSVLLTSLDAASQTRFPDLVAQARSPTLGELRKALAVLRADVEDEARRGGDPAVAIFYSGHGFLAAEGSPALALADGALTQVILQDEILKGLPAKHIHLMVDACHAEALVRPKDLQATVVAVSETERLRYVNRSTLTRFPHVGVLMASTASAQTHEWDLYGSGIFTYQLLSGLRGGADVNGDGHIEYSEMAAFLSAANRDVSDPRAHLQAFVAPPRADPRVPLVDLSTIRSAGRLRGEPASLGAIYLEDARGNRLVDLRAEVGHRVELIVPADETVYVRSPKGESAMRLAPGETRLLGSLHLEKPTIRARGAIESMLRRGLFATPFGVSYYKGFVDHSDFVPVLFGREAGPVPGEDARISTRETGRLVAFGTAGVLAVTAVALGWSAADAHDDFEAARFEREATLAKNRFESRSALAIGSAVASVVAAGVGTWFHFRW